MLTSPKKCGIFVKKSRIIQTVEAEIKAVDAPTESSGWWDPGGDFDPHQVFCDVRAYVSCREYDSISQRAWRDP